MNDLITVTGLHHTVIDIVPAAFAARDEVLNDARQVATIDDELDLDFANQTLKRLKDVSKLVEASRKEVKAPVLDVGRRIDGLAKEFLSDIASETARIGKLIADSKPEDTPVRVQVRSFAKFEITDEAELLKARPDLFSPDETKIRAALKITKSIPGLRVWEEKKAI